MNKEAFEKALEYIEDQSIQAQITYNGKGGYTVDFKSRIHTEVCASELKYHGFHDVMVLTTGTHMRIK